MKNLMSLLLFLVIVLPHTAFADEMNHSGSAESMTKEGMVRVYQCPMDGYASKETGECPRCGMNLEEKEMTSDAAQAALEKSKPE